MSDCPLSTVPAVLPALPAPLAAWFARRGWRPYPHQLAVLDVARRGRSVLLRAPTGSGKTLAGFLPTLVDLAETPRPGLHTLYVSPLKALAADIARNLERPVGEAGLSVTFGVRTGDTTADARRRQRVLPPNILLTTPESLALLLSFPESARFFANLRTIVVDEVHDLAGTKRGDQLALCLARFAGLACGAVRVGLSATAPHPKHLLAFLSTDGRGTDVEMIQAPAGAAPQIEIRLPPGSLPWSGHMGLMAAEEIYRLIRAYRSTIVFVNTRAQAELVFAALWRLNEDNLAIALHHGSLARGQRQRVEAAMTAGQLRAVVATSSLDLGIDWGEVDLVVQVGAPKGVSRLLQRIGRANHRWDEPSRAVLIPANRFELLECLCALTAAREGALDGEPPPPGGLDVLAQHVMGRVCAGPVHPDDLFAEVKRAAPYADLDRRDFDDVVRFVEDGGYALAAYEQYRRVFRDAEGKLHLTHPRAARRWRLNVGTIVEAPLLTVKLSKGWGGAGLGEVEEYFVSLLKPGDTFLFAGRVLRFERLRGTTVECSPATGNDPKVPAYAGGRLPLTTFLADRVRALLQNPAAWTALPADVSEWLELQRRRSRLPAANELLVETFPRGGRWFLIAYCFAGRNAHQTLGMLVTRRMERAGLRPLGFVATDYVLAVWSAEEPHDVADLFDEDLLGEDLEEWMAESSLLRRTFRHIAVISGLIERKQVGGSKTGYQVTVNSDLLYDVLRKFEPNHVLLRAARQDAARGLVDVGRVAHLLRQTRGRIVHMALSRVSPLAVPVLLDVGKERVATGEREDALLAEAEAAQLLAEACGEAEPPAGLAAPSRHHHRVHPVHRANAARDRKRPARGLALGTPGRATLRIMRTRRASLVLPE